MRDVCVVPVLKQDVGKRKGERKKREEEGAGVGRGGKTHTS